MPKPFKVASVSDNMNSFGLRGMVLIARDGEAWEIGANSVNVIPKGHVINVIKYRGKRDWVMWGFEIPRRLPKAPKKVVAEVWK